VIEPVIDLLARRIGLAVDSIGVRAVESAVRARARATRGGDVRAYVAAVARDDAEIAQLIDEIVVPESWFFRDRAPFEHLVKHARAILAKGARRFRALSLPCAAGEEPYSIVMTLLDAGLDPDTFTVDAIDVSARLVAQAERGLFDKRSFRTTAEAVRARHFDKVEGGWCLRPRARACAHFFVGNLVDPKLLAGKRGYHAIFFRNLLIYLTPAARAAALASVEVCLAPDGVLYAGHSERIDQDLPILRPVAAPGVFAFARVPASAAGAKGPMHRAPTPRPRPPVRVGRAPSPPPRKAAPAALAPPPPPSAPSASISRCRALADRGQVGLALVEAEALLEIDPRAPEVLCLLGVLRVAIGDRDRGKAYLERALERDPNHYEALVHLGLVAKALGDSALAGSCQARAASLSTDLGRGDR
jgi:chemotaxis protein methyltransferase WspC